MNLAMPPNPPPAAAGGQPMPERMRARVARARALPPLPSVALELLQVLGDEGCDVNRLSQIIGQDQAITARVLQVANSPFYGMRARIASIQDAVVVLGLGTVRALVTAATLRRALPEAAVSGFCPRQFWQHALGCGVCARMLAQELRQNAEVLFTAGLLHDIGRLALVVVDPEAMAQVCAASGTAPHCVVERSVLGFDHAEFGAALAAHWNFPPVVVAGIARHHSPDGEGGSVLADVLHVADALSHALDFGSGPDGQVPPVSTAALARLGLTEAALAPLLARAEAHYEGLQPLVD